MAALVVKQAEFNFKLGWTYNNGPGCTQSSLGQLAMGMNTTYWYCTSGCGNKTTLSNVNYVCTGASSTEDWEQGERSFKYTFPSSGPFTISFSGGDWRSLNHGTAGSWNIQTVVNLGQRPDTRFPNHSPQTLSRPSYTFQFACNIKLKIPMIDADDDNVRCRWAVGNECASVCQILPNAVLDQNTCTLSFPSSHAKNGWYAVAITVEDFPKTDLVIGGHMYTRNTALSSVPLQFLINTPNLPGSCNDKPMFVHTTPAEGKLVVIPAHQSLDIRFYAQSSKTIKSITLTAPSGLQHNSLQNDDQARPYVKYIEITWTPTQPQKGSHILCGLADDNIGKISDPRCITLLAWDINPCTSDPCYNSATCSRTGLTDTFICTCVAGYTGYLCQIDIDECASHPCQFGSTCNDLINHFTCTCIPGYTGTLCDIDIDECASHPCQFGSTCNDLINHFTCTCLPGYTGTLCDIDINECASHPCQFGSTCNDLINNFTCTCLPGYTGTLCDIDIDECASQPCQLGSTCNDLINHFTCTCVPGYTGTLCDIDIDECASTPCLNNATCNDLIDNFTCDCIPGFTDYTCSTDIDECASQPCQFGSTCNDLINQFTCTCVPSYTGTLCDIEINECLPEPCGILYDCHDEINAYRCTINPLYLTAILLSSILFMLLLMAFILRRKRKVYDDSDFPYVLPFKEEIQMKSRYVHHNAPVSPDTPVK